ncbi:hypothetical protein SB784_36255, partial [Burkholderia sp. SIMBA_048]
GAIYGVRLLQTLRKLGGVESHLLISSAGWLNINLDPYNEQGADIELSWSTFNGWGLHDQGAIDVIDQMTDERFQWHGRWQHVRLDP